MFQIIPCIMADIYWNFLENALIYFTVILLNGTPSRQDGRTWNSVVGRETQSMCLFFLVSCLIYPENFMEICWPFSMMFLTATSEKRPRLFLVHLLLKMRWCVFRNVANRHGFLWKYRRRNPVSNGVKWNTQNCPESSMLHAGPFLKISWKSVYAFVRNVANKQTDRKPTEMKT